MTGHVMNEHDMGAGDGGSNGIGDGGTSSLSPDGNGIGHIDGGSQI